MRLVAKHTGSVVLTVLVALVLGLPPLAAQEPPPNILLVVLDDVGIEHLSFYGFRGPPPQDPPYADTGDFLDSFALTWLRFDNAWSKPFCSPTRAAFHSGRYGFRTGIGHVINDNMTYGLDVFDPDLLPELLRSTANGTTRYHAALFGKWHLGTSDGTHVPDQGAENAPREAGYDRFWATLVLEQEEPVSELNVPYFHFWETVDGVAEPEEFGADLQGPNPDPSIYLTRHYREKVANWINEQEAAGRTWFAYVPFFSAHGPWDCPLNQSGTPYEGETFECSAQPGNNQEEYRSMIKTIDIELDQLLNNSPSQGGIDWDADTSRTLVIIMGDNGSPSTQALEPVDGAKAKGTVAQGGVRVPLLVGGWNVSGGRSVDDVVVLSDLYATILDVAQKSVLDPRPTDEDSKSLKPLFTDPLAVRPHDMVYTDTFFPNFEPGSGFGPCWGLQAVREDAGLHATATYKYLRRMDGVEALFDLDIDEWETNNLIEDPPDQSRLDALVSYMDVTLGADLDFCTKKKSGEDCSQDSECCSNICEASACRCPLP